MGILEIGGYAGAVVAVSTLISKLVKLITTIQTLINRLDQLQIDVQTAKELWEKTTDNYVNLNQRVRDIEFQLAIV